MLQTRRRFGGVKFPEPTLWYDFSDGSTLTLVGSDIDQVADKSINSNNAAIAPLSTNRPLLVTAGQNGLDTARFDGVNSYLQAIHTISNANNLTVLIAYKYITFTAGMRMYAVANTNQLNGLIEHQKTATTNALLGERLPQNIPLIIIETDLTSFVALGYKTSNNVDFEISLNGEIRYSDNQNKTADLVLNNVFLGSGNAGNSKSNIEVGEFMLFENEITTAQFILVSRYLSEKWGV